AVAGRGCTSRLASRQCCHTRPRVATPRTVDANACRVPTEAAPARVCPRAPWRSLASAARMRGWISALWTRQLIEAAGAHGVPTAPLWQRAGIAPSATADTRIADSVHLAIWEQIMHAARDPAFPVAAGARMRLDDYDALALACKTAATANDALTRIVRYLALW